MITDNEKFIEIQAILASSNINTRDCAKINDLIIELSKENQQEMNNVAIQQKEFIKWLENYLELFNYDNIDEQGYYDMLEEILQKYKNIIGVSDDKTN